MATAAVPYVMLSGSKAKASEVNANLDAIISFLNTETDHLDGSKVFTGIPTLPASDPISANQATRKSYVDALVAAAAVVAAGLVTTEAAARVAGDAATLASAVAADTALVAALGAKITAGFNTGTTDGSGDISISWGETLSGIPAVNVQAREASSFTIAPYSVSTTGCIVRVFNPATAAAVTARAIVLQWIAVVN